MSEHKLKEWKKLREEGKSFSEIGKMYGVSRQAVWEALDKTGDLKSKTKYSEYHKEWEGLYKFGIPIKEIAEKYGVKYQTVHYYLKYSKKKKSE